MKEKEIEKIKYWTEIAEYDLITAKAMLETKRFLYVGFMCHQTIEKILKAMHVLKFPTETPPYTHDLLKLAKLTCIYEQMNEEQKNVIRTLQPLNIESRYPSYKDDIFSSLSKERCAFILNQTEGLCKWIKEQL
jgi:HEPN domain-containing protein